MTRRLGVLALLAAVLLSGCVGLKGTPFGTEDHKTPRGDPRKRVPLWPLMYYREPALSVLWPLFELSDTHVALRPFFSVEGLDQKQQVYNVLWPLAQIDNQTGHHYVFPLVWWGQPEGEEDYTTLFPLYWHKGDPYWGKDGHDRFFPLWWIDRWSYGEDQQGYSAYFLGPLIHAYRGAHCAGWHVFPLAGNYGTDTGYYRFALWPLMHQWKSKTGNKSGDCIFPLYYRSKSDDESKFFSLPYWYAGLGDGDYWRLVPPLFYQDGDKDGERFTFLSLPYCFARRPDGDSWQLVPPLFYRAWNDRRGESTFVSPLWAQGRSDEDKTAWHTAIPFYLYKKWKDGYSFNTLLGGYGVGEAGRGWWLLPLLSAGSSDEDSAWRMLGLLFHDRHGKEAQSQALWPIYRYAKDEDERSLVVFPLLSGATWAPGKGEWLSIPLLSGGYWSGEQTQFLLLAGLAARSKDQDSSYHHVLPFYVYSAQGGDSLFVSLPYSTGQGADGSHWHLVPPLFFRGRDPDGDGQLITPLWMQGSADQGKTRWHALVPLYLYRDRPDESLFATLLGGFETDADGRHWLLYPLLSGGWAGDEAGEVWIVAPLIHAKWDAAGTSHHVLPLYYWDGKTRTFLSPLAARWHHGDGKRTTLLVPPLSWLTESEPRDDLWLLGPLARFSWGEEGGQHHVIPLFYADNRTGRFLSPAVAWWQNDRGGKTTAIPPLLSWLAAGEQRSDLWALGPLAHFSWGEEGGPQHVFPLYYRNNKTGTFLSPLAAWWRRSGGGKTYLLPPALSWLSTGDRRKDLWLLGPLAHFSWGEKSGSQHVFPLYYRDDESGTLISPVAASWRNDRGGKTTAVPPALSWLSTKDQRKDLWLLGPLAHFSWGEKGGPEHVLPLYYRNRRKGKFISPFLATWKNADGRNWLCPPLLSAYIDSDNGDNDVWGLLGLFHHRWRDEPGRRTRGHLFPLYAFDSEDYVYTPLVGWNNDEDDAFVYPLTPLFGLRTGKRHTGSWLFPLYSYKHDRKTGLHDTRFLWGDYWWQGERSGSGLFPLYCYSNRGPVDSVPKDGWPHGEYGQSFFCLPICWYENKSYVNRDRDGKYARRYEKNNGAFPLWRYSKTSEKDGARVDASGNLLLFLYDYKHTVDPAEKQPGKTDSYTRHRVLFRVWHYERLNDDVSVDVFPAIGYDKRADGSWQFSFLWRLFRWGHQTGRGTDLDLLFIPLSRARDD